MSRSAVVALSATALALAACSLFTSLDGFSASGEPSPDASGADAEPDAPSDAGDGGPSDAGSDGHAACATDGGTPMIDIGTSCVDGTEVTRADYAAFLASGASPAMPPACAYRTSHVPSAGWPPAVGTGLLPVGYVDWCDAYAYCAWAGRRLCGRVGGGALASVDVNGSKDEWYRACSAAGAHAYPYGDAFRPSACNGADAGVGYVASVGSFKGCEGGYTGLFDMSGNAFEHVDFCDGTIGAGDNCAARGGSFQSVAADDLSCARVGSVARASTFSDLGIRCCRDRR